MSTPDGKIGNILLVDKPKGISSYQVIRILQKKFSDNEQTSKKINKKVKMGHAGTLDPLATGLLIIGIGKGTKELAALIGLPKVYEATILLGIQTETGDTDGIVIIEKEIPAFTKEKIEEILSSLVGKINLAVPLYSAIKREGKPLYQYAREGKEIDVPIKEMEIKSLELVNFDTQRIQIRCNVGSGTYIRSLAEEIGRRLGTVATVEKLRRTSIGNFSVTDALILD